MDKLKITELLNHISPRLREHLKSLSMDKWAHAEEIRISSGKPATIASDVGIEYIATPKGKFICDPATLTETLMLLTDNSIYTANDKLINGFITIKGGHRAGICGTTVITNGNVSAIKDISSINIRICREIKGIVHKVADYIITNGEIKNTLIISPPRCGKTTLLRDIARFMGDTRKTAIVDERSEIAAMHMGEPQCDVGIHTDVLNSCPKHIGIPLIIRSMAPEVIITDEIGAAKDAEAINYAVCSGVKIITTAHGDGIDDLLTRKGFEDIIRFFDVFIILTNAGGVGSIKSILRREEIDF